MSCAGKGDTHKLYQVSAYFLRESKFNMLNGAVKKQPHLLSVFRRNFLSNKFVRVTAVAGGLGVVSEQQL